MRARSLILVAVALIAAVGTAYFVRNWTRAQRPIVVERVEAAAPAPGAEILVAARELAAGRLIGAGDLAWRAWPEDGIDESFVAREDDASMAAFEGAVVRLGLAAGEPITEARVVRPGVRGFLAAILTPGMRAVSVPVSAATGIAGLVFPGDRVDVILIHSLEAEAGGVVRTLRASETVLTNLRVLALDQRVADTGEGPIVAKTATLEVSAKQAETLAMLTEMGQLSLSLRSLEREGPPEGEPGALAPIDAAPSYTLDNQVSALLTPPRVAEPAPARTVTVMRGADAEARTFAAPGPATP